MDVGDPGDERVVVKKILVRRSKTVMGTTLSILRDSTLFFVQEMSNSVVDVIETLREA